MGVGVGVGVLSINDRGFFVSREYLSIQSFNFSIYGHRRQYNDEDACDVENPTRALSSWFSLPPHLAEVTATTTRPVRRQLLGKHTCKITLTGFLSSFLRSSIGGGSVCDRF